MPRTFNAAQLQSLLQSLFDTYMKLPARMGNNFADYYICIACNRIKNESGTCRCGKVSKMKSSRKKKTKKQVGIPKAIKSSQHDYYK